MIDLRGVLQSKFSPCYRNAMRESARKLTRKQKPRQPLTGAWYWLPTLNDQGCLRWKLESFYDSWKPTSAHVYVWRHVLDVLQWRWDKTLGGIECYSLPRGRVAQMVTSRNSPPVFGIFHGDDAPLKKTWLKLVLKEFLLPKAALVIFDEHEQCIAGQPEALSQALGYDLKVRGVEMSELDWNDD